MKRTVPLLITAIGGFVLIVAFFIPYTESWGETAAIWFDVLASIAFILGGGSLLKVHLKKISDRARGWGYSAVTLLSFLVVLYFGLFKVGSQPASKQEHFGETFAPLALSDLPESQITKVPGKIPVKGDEKPVPASARRQLSQEGRDLVFRGWMLDNQKTDLIAYQDELEWQAAIEDLHDAAQPPEPLKGKIAYYSDHQAISFTGAMSEKQKLALLALPKADSTAWKAAVESLYERSNVKSSIPLKSLPVTIPKGLKDVVKFDAKAETLSIVGPMSTSQRDALAKRFPLAKPLRGQRRADFLAALESQGEKLTDEQLVVFSNYLDGGWAAEQLIKTLNVAGDVQEVEKTNKEMLKEKKAGVKDIQLKKTVGVKTTLTPQHLALIQAFTVADEAIVETPVSQLNDVDTGRLEEAFLKSYSDWIDTVSAMQTSHFAARQEKALKTFAGKNPTVGERNSRLCIALLRAGSLSDKQREFLTKDYKLQDEWRQTVGMLFQAAHTPKYRWSGDYRETGTPFWWMYEYAFKPLTATMFAMLAFYVASAAFRAFRAKNTEASLLLGTAFIILLGRTFAGVALTSWIPESLAGLRIDNLTVYIMSVFNTAGTRAIMIGIALGIASTSLKVLLGVDRSYLGSQED